MTIDLEALYIDLHRHPELSFQETRTAGIVTQPARPSSASSSRRASARRASPTSIQNGDGPVIWLRADMDGLPVEEHTGLAYASTARGIDPSGTGCSRSCTRAATTCTSRRSSARSSGSSRTKDEWSGTIVAVFQPAEEYGAGAQAMIADGVLDRFPKPDIVLGQHLTPLPAGTIGVRSGTQMAASDGLTVTLLGRGGHGSRPHSTIDPVVMAAATVMRLQTIVSREVDPRDVAVVTVGSIHAGLKNNIIPAEAKLELSLRYPDDEARARVLEKVERIVRAEAAASGAEQQPVIVVDHSLPPTINDVDATARLTRRVRRRLRRGHGRRPRHVHRQRGRLVVRARGRRAARVLVLGRRRPRRRTLRPSPAGTVERDIPTNHSPFFAPVLHPTIERGVDALVVAAREFLARADHEAAEPQESGGSALDPRGTGVRKP